MLKSRPHKNSGYTPVFFFFGGGEGWEGIGVLVHECTLKIPPSHFSVVVPITEVIVKSCVSFSHLCILLMWEFLDEGVDNTFFIGDVFVVKCVANANVIPQYGSFTNDVITECHYSNALYCCGRKSLFLERVDATGAI